MHITSRHRLLRNSLFLFGLFTKATEATEAASGPTAYISIDSSAPFPTMKPCARSCLVYEGIWACGVNSGYYDLGIELSCGCSPQNFCYCDSNAAASASSYISSCVNDGCGTQYPAEVTSALDAYNGYCTTATVAAAVDPATTSSEVVSSSTTSAGPTKSSGTSTSRAAAETSSNTAIGTGNATGGSEGSDTSTEKKNGLSSSDVIALGVGLGVGVPSLVLGIATFCLQRRGRNRRQSALQVGPAEVRYIR